ncbi:MAG: efflux RND transporter periplasmic adaptor subunit, partial [Anaerolineaceae bacterium]|nr:efflux RND transporter periplasmic adaptor subunit [Anaerolineaceae bacterium]
MNATKTSAIGAGSKRKGIATRVIVTILVVLAVGGGAAWYFLGRNTPAKTQGLEGSTTSTITVERGDLSLTASGSGTLVTNQTVNMSFSTSGKVAELNVKLGDMVKTGDVLASLEKAEDLEANLASAQANLLQAQQTLAALQKKAGSTLAVAYQDLIAAQAAYDDAFAASQRTDSVRCSPEILSKYRTALEQATQKLNELYKQDPNSDAATVAGYDYDTALANYSYCTAYSATEKTSAQATLEVAKTALQEAEDTYNKLKAASGIDPDILTMDETKVETAQTQVTTAQEALDGITLKASIDGKVTFLAAGVGTIVDTSTFLTISDISRPTVTVSLDETDMDKLVVGNLAKVTFTALPGQTFTGKVSVANPQMNSFGSFRAATGQVELDPEAVKTMETVPLGLSASITITGKEAKNVLLVP